MAASWTLSGNDGEGGAGAGSAPGGLRVYGRNIGSAQPTRLGEICRADARLRSVDVTVLPRRHPSPEGGFSFALELLVGPGRWNFPGVVSHQRRSVLEHEAKVQSSSTTALRSREL